MANKKPDKYNFLCPGPVDTPFDLGFCQAFDDPTAFVQANSYNTFELRRLGTSGRYCFRWPYFWFPMKHSWITGFGNTLMVGFFS